MRNRNTKVMTALSEQLHPSGLSRTMQAAYNAGRVGGGAKKFLNICGNEIEIDAAASSVDSNATNTRKVYRAALQTKYQHVRA